MQSITAAQNIGTRNQRNRVAGSIQLNELIRLIVDLQQVEGGVDVVDHMINLLYEHRGVHLGERRLVIETPVIVHALADSEDLVLQRVGVVTDNADLDGRDGPLLLLGMPPTILKNWRSVLTDLDNHNMIKS
jgi:hypothetical protein